MCTCVRESLLLVRHQEMPSTCRLPVHQPTVSLILRPRGVKFDIVWAPHPHPSPRCLKHLSFSFSLSRSLSLWKISRAPCRSSTGRRWEVGVCVRSGAYSRCGDGYLLCSPRALMQRIWVGSASKEGEPGVYKPWPTGNAWTMEIGKDLPRNSPHTTPHLPPIRLL